MSDVYFTQTPLAINYIFSFFAHILFCDYHWLTFIVGFDCDRFTSDVKIKSISIVGGADGTSPSKMRA